jgi:hypothetical protein
MEHLKVKNIISTLLRSSRETYEVNIISTLLRTSKETYGLQLYVATVSMSRLCLHLEIMATDKSDTDLKDNIIFCYHIAIAIVRFCIVQRATARSKTEIHRDYVVDGAPLVFQAG